MGQNLKVNELSDWEAFLAVAAQGSFSAAARELKLPLSQVSKRVARLESQMNTRFFHRTTRVVNLTNEGKALLPKIQANLEDLQETESLFESQQELSGKIKITSVAFIAERLLLPIFSEFTKLHPKIHLELELSEKFTSLIDSGFDLAVRIETPKDSELVYRKLAPNDLVFCASPQYLKKNKAPLNSPKDLKHHDLLMLNIHHRCHFKNHDLSLGEFKSTKKMVCDDGAFLTKMALAGEGVLVRSIWDVKDSLREGKLVQVLKKHELETFGHIYAVVPNKRFLAPRVRNLLDFIVSKSETWKS